MQRPCRKVHNVNQTACTDAYRVRPYSFSQIVFAVYFIQVLSVSSI